MELFHSRWLIPGLFILLYSTFFADAEYLLVELEEDSHEKVEGSPQQKLANQKMNGQRFLSHFLGNFVGNLYNLHLSGKPVANKSMPMPPIPPIPPMPSIPPIPPPKTPQKAAPLPPGGPPSRPSKPRAPPADPRVNRRNARAPPGGEIPIPTPPTDALTKEPHKPDGNRANPDTEPPEYPDPSSNQVPGPEKVAALPLRQPPPQQPQPPGYIESEEYYSKSRSREHLRLTKNRSIEDLKSSLSGEDSKFTTEDLGSLEEKSASLREEDSEEYLDQSKDFSLEPKGVR